MSKQSDTPRRFCPVSYAHLPHDTCDGTPFDAIRELSEVTRERNKLTVKLRLANVIVAVIDDWVRRNLLDARSALADARLDYGDPFSEDVVKAMLTDLQTEERARRVAAERELEELRKALKKHHDGNHFLENSPPNCYKCGLAFAALTPPEK